MWPISKTQNVYTAEESFSSSPTKWCHFIFWDDDTCENLWSRILIKCGVRERKVSSNGPWTKNRGEEIVLFITYRNCKYCAIFDQSGRISNTFTECSYYTRKNVTGKSPNLIDIVSLALPIPIEKSHNSQQGHCLGPGTTRPQAKWFLGPWPLSIWELHDFSMSMGSFVHPMTHRNEGPWLLGNHAFPNTPFLHWFCHWSWDNM